MKLLYKIIFAISLLFILSSSASFISSLKELSGSLQHNALTLYSVLGVCFALGFIIAFIFLLVISYAYIQDRVQLNRLSQISFVVIGISLVLNLLLKIIPFILLLMSGGYLALIPGIFSSFASAAELLLALYFLFFVILAYSFIQSSEKKVFKSIVLVVSFLLVVISWIAAKSPVNSKEFSFESAQKITVGSTDGWKTYENPEVGVAFKYPPTIPAPTYYGVDGLGNPNLYITNENRSKVLDIEIGQKRGDGRTCGECVPMTLDEAMQSSIEYMKHVSPNSYFKKSSFEINGKTYPAFALADHPSKGSDVIIVVPNKVSPNDFAVISGGEIDLNTLYSIVDSFTFIEKKAVTEYTDPNGKYTYSAPSGFAISNTEREFLIFDKDLQVKLLNEASDLSGNWEKYKSLGNVTVGGVKSESIIWKLKVTSGENTYIISNTVKSKGNSYTFLTVWLNDKKITDETLLNNFSKVVAGLKVI